MRYVIRTPEGKEYGPAEQDVLVQWAQNGRITQGCQMRNTLMKKWHDVEDVDFLADIVEAQTPEETATVGEKWSNLLNPTADLQKKKSSAASSLNKGGVFKYTAASVGLRGLAFFFDAIVLGLVALVLLVGCTTVIPGDGAFLCFTALYFIVTVAYYSLALGFTAQTVGQYFWGLIIIRPEGEPVLLGRAFMFTIFMLLVWPTTLVFSYCLPSKRALQDMLSGVVIARIRNTD
jgi:uncharacterized RDD family membrane protein YckC